MKYQIFELVGPSILKKYEPDGYHMKSTQGIVLQDVDIDRYGFEERHESIESAMNEIEEYSDDLKSKTLTIIPIIKIDYDGEVRK